ncbi:hypothetical protein FB451DRAFT_1438002 [Mycena latifolia]|nr:hypothetical protein FB451DRAFT_1438002 [Mycena latifolia]
MAPQTPLPRLDLATGQPLVRLVNNSDRPQYPDFSQSKQPVPPVPVQHLHTPQPPSFHPHAHLPQAPEDETDYFTTFFAQMAPEEQQKMLASYTFNTTGLGPQASADPTMHHPSLDPPQASMQYSINSNDGDIDYNADTGSETSGEVNAVDADGAGGVENTGGEDGADDFSNEGGGGGGSDDEYEDDPWADQPEDDSPDPLAALLADATSLLKVTMRAVDPAHVRRLAKRRHRESQAASNTAAASSSPPSDAESDSDQAPPKKKKKNQASRSIKVIDADLQEICEVAYNYLKIYLTNILPWPRVGRAGGPATTDDQFEVLLLLGTVRSRISQFRGGLKVLAVLFVPDIYGFQDIQKLKNPNPENIAKVIAENRALVAQLKTTFHFLDPQNPTAPNTMCRNRIFQILLGAYWFRKDADNRAYYFKGRTQLEWETLAFIASAVLCGIDHYKTGRFAKVSFDAREYYPHYKKILAGLREWESFYETQAAKHNTRNLALELKEAMLRDARAAAENDASEDEGGEDTEDGFFSMAMFTANQVPTPAAAPTPAAPATESSSSVVV